MKIYILLTCFVASAFAKCRDSSSEPVNCAVDPCTVSQCDAIPEALCFQDPCADGCQAVWFTKDDVNVTDQCDGDVDLGMIYIDDVDFVDSDEEEEDADTSKAELEQASKAAKKDEWLARKHAMHAERWSKKLSAKKEWRKHNKISSNYYRTSERKEERNAHHREKETMKGERKEHTKDENEARQEHHHEFKGDTKAEHVDMWQMQKKKWDLMKAERKVAKQASRTERKEQRPEHSEERMTISEAWRVGRKTDSSI